MLRRARNILWSATAVLIRRKTDAFLKDQLMKIQAGSIVLNIGSGGSMARIVRECAAQRGFVVTSTDIDPARGPDRVDDITKSAFPDNSFDVVTIMEVLEHVTNPHAAANEIKRVLKPGGRLILSTPFIFPLHDRPMDFFRFTKYGLQHLFGDLNDLVIEEQNNWAEAMLVLNVRLSAERSPVAKILGGVMLVLSYLLLPVAYVISRLIRTDFITSGYVLTGQKRS
jgi:SAM-dependent methyltransferase